MKYMITLANTKKLMPFMMAVMLATTSEQLSMIKFPPDWHGEPIPFDCDETIDEALDIMVKVGTLISWERA